MSNTNTIKSSFSELLNNFSDDGIESVLFTTFNYSSSFFEKNVLPMIAAYPDDDIVNMTDSQINEKLENIKVAVICDRSTNPEPKSSYRYGVLPCGLKNAYFHPKLVIVKGKLKNGQLGAKTLVTSANLTLSGWGINREVAGLCTIGKQQANELNQLIIWIKEQQQKQNILAINNGVDYEHNDEAHLHLHIKELKDFLDKNCRQNTSNEPKLYIRIPNKSSNNFLERILKSCDKPLQHMTVVSPYWSEAKDLQPTFNKLDLESIILVPSIGLDGNRKLPISIRKEFYPQPKYGEFKDLERFTHAKSIELTDNKNNNYILIGSANFTKAAMGSEDCGNIEAMLVYHFDKPGKIMDHISSIKEDAIHWAKDGDADDSPPPIPPFYSSAIYDWEKHLFICQLECNANVRKKIKSINYEGKDLALKKSNKDIYTTTLKINLTKPSYYFELHYIDKHTQSEVFRGLVTQWNAKDDELQYLPQPKLSMILDQLRALDINKQPGHGGGFNQGSSTDGNGDRDEDIEESFDFFSIFQAFFKLRAYFKKKPELDPFCRQTPNSIALLFRALQLEQPRNDAQIIRYYILLSELNKTVQEITINHTKSKNISLSIEIEKQLKKYEPVFLELLKNSPLLSQLIGSKNNNNAAKAVLNWFKSEI